MPWKVVKVDEQEEDATVSWTSREKSTALYKVEEVAKISSDDAGVCPVNTSTAVSAGAFSISVFNEVHIFDREQFSFLATLSLDSNVDTMAWSPDSQFLVVGDCSGVIHFFSFASRDVVFSTKLVDIARKSDKSSPAFCNCMFKGNEVRSSVNLISVDARMYSIKDLPLRNLSVALESKDETFISKLKENIQMEVVEVMDIHDKVSFCAVETISGKCASIVAGSGNAAVSIWSDKNILDVIDLELLKGTGARKCQVSPDSKYLFVLDECSNLSIWDAHTLVMLRYVDCPPVKDFVLTSSAATSEADTVGADGGQIVLLTGTERDETQLEIYQLPQFQKTYSMEVSQNCFLAESCCYQDKVFYIEESANKINNNTTIDLLYKCLSEASPEHRIYNLVRKKKFDSALQCSKAFGLDVEFVYKAKSNSILADISTKISESDTDLEERAVSVDTLIEELQNSLENVKSVEFCVNCCLKASPPTLEQVYRLLCFAKEKVGKISGKDKHKYNQVMLEVMLSLHRLETFKMIFGDAGFTAHKWQQFCNGDMLMQVMQFLSQGKMTSAAIIWRRHQSEFEGNLTAESLRNVLESVRSDLPSHSIISWLRSYLVPSVICCSAEDALYALASWLEQRVTSLELSEKEEWPNNGLEMAMLLFDVVSKCAEENSSYKDIPTPLFVDQVHGSALVEVCRRANTTNPVSSLSLLVEHLIELKKLHTNYHCKIPLAEFTKKTALAIMFKMLDSVLAIELIPNVINNQIMQYGIQHGFQIDDILLKYISNEVKQVSVSGLSNTLCEARLVEIAKCIKTRRIHFEAVLLLMSWVSVPWSGVVEEMVGKAMADDPTNESLKCSYSLMESKKILSHYGLRGIEFSNDSHVKGVVKYILAAPSETALEDALQIVETYHCLTIEEVYFIRLQNLCLKGLLTDCIQLLKVVPKSQIVSVVQKFLIWVSVVIEDHPVDETDSKEHIVVTEGAVHILEHLQNVGETSHDINTTLMDLKNILALQKEFSIFITINSYQDVSTKEEILLTYLEEHSMFMSIITQQEEEEKSKEDKVLRLGSLFGLSNFQLQSKILIHDINDGSDWSLAACCECLRKIKEELSPEEVFNLCMKLLQKLIIQDTDEITSSETNVSMMLYRLACFSVLHGQASSLHDYLECCKLCWLSSSLNVHCESGDLSLSTSICEEGPLLSWNNGNQFKDDGFVLDASVAIPLLHKVAAALMLVHQDPTKNLERLTIACRDLIGYLQENNLNELALQYAIHSLSLLLQNCAFEEEQKERNVVNTGKISRVCLLNEMAVHGSNYTANILLNLMSKVLHCSNIDHNLALGYLCSIPEDAVLQMLKRDFAVGQGHNSSQFVTVFRIALYYATNFCSQSMVNAVEELYTAALWYSRLWKLNITCGSLLTGEMKEAKKVLELLLEKPGVDVKFIIEFCKSFDIEVDAALHSYIQINLVGNGTCSLSKDPNGNSDVTEMETRIKNFENNLLNAVGSITNVANLLLLLKDVLRSFSPYDYERIAIVMNEIIKHSSEKEQAAFGKQLEVLEILSKYERTASPSEYEILFHTKESAASIKDMSELSKKYSQERLPFHALVSGNPWKIIAPELTDETTPKLLPLCRLLKMQEDQVYVTAVNNLISSCPLDQQTESTSAGSTQVELPSSKFEKAAKLLSLVNNPEFAVKAAITLLTKWPLSEEKVKAAKATVGLAFEWKSSCDGDKLQNATKIYKIAKDICQEIAIKHILYSRGITEECFNKFKNKPAKLICQLYEVYGCAERMNCPNVQKIAEEIAEVCDLNIGKIRAHLIETWLPSTSPGSIRSQDYSRSENKVKDQLNLKRVRYLLDSGSMQKNALFLLNFAYRSGPSKITYESRVRAMEVLFNVTTPKIIEAVASDSFDGIRNYMKTLIYLAELEHLHFPQSVESFQHCNKEGLVKGLWKNHKDNRNAVLLIADICLDSKISDPQIWTNILRQLLYLGLTKYLSNILPSLIKFPNLWQTSNLVKIWEEVSVKPMQKAVTPLSMADRTSCQQSMLLLQRCPVLLKVDMLSVFQKLLQLGMLSYALGCLLLLPDVKKPTNLGAWLSHDSVKNVLDMIAEENAVGGCLVCPDVMEALVFEFIYTSSCYEVLKDSKHFLKLADYLISEKKFAEMIMKIIKVGELKIAVKLAQHYEMYGTPLKKKLYLQTKDSMDGLVDLLNFLESAEILEDALPYLPVVDKPKVVDEKPKLKLNSNESGEVDSSDNVDLYDVF